MIQKKQDDKKKKGIAAEFNRYKNQVAATVLRGIKMASEDILSPLVNPLKLLEVLKQVGPQALVWKPETLCSFFDQNFGGWSKEKAADALIKFHDTGDLHTSVPMLVRQKLYSIRIISTSDTAHTEWNIFEKVGSAFNGRPSSFSVIEPLSPAECAVNVALIDAIRPDTFSYEVKAYIAASCHQGGLYTLKPSKYLSMADELLSMMNREETGRETDVKIVNAITEKLEMIKKDPSSVTISDEDFITAQAIKLLAIDASGDESLKTEVF